MRADDVEGPVADHHRARLAEGLQRAAERLGLVLGARGQVGAGDDLEVLAQAHRGQQRVGERVRLGGGDREPVAVQCGERLGDAGRDGRLGQRRLLVALAVAVDAGRDDRCVVRHVEQLAEGVARTAGRCRAAAPRPCGRAGRAWRRRGARRTGRPRASPPARRRGRRSRSSSSPRILSGSSQSALGVPPDAARMTKAQELLAAKARRVRLARRRVVAATLAAFVLAWGVVAFDGSMGTTTVASTATTSTDRRRRPRRRTTRPRRRRPRRRRRHGTADHQPVMTEHAFWITSRAAGIIALLAASIAVALGLLMSTPLRKRIPEARVLHEALSLATMVALAVHAARAARRQLLQAVARGHHDPVRPRLLDGPRDRRRLAVRDPRALVLHPRAHRPGRAGARCTASPRSPGCSASCTR